MDHGEGAPTDVDEAAAKPGDDGHGRPRVNKVVSYLAGGGLQFWGAQAMFTLLNAGFGWPTFWPTRPIADAVGAVVGFLAHHHVTFRSTHRSDNVRRRLAKFYALMSINFVVGLVGQRGLMHVMSLAGVDEQLTAYIAPFVMAALSTVWNYFLLDRWVFTRGDEAAR